MAIATSIFTTAGGTGANTESPSTTQPSLVYDTTNLVVKIFDGTTVIQVPTLTSTSTLTNKTLTSPVITGATEGDTKVLAASITYTSNVTAATITGFSWTVAAAATYVFEVDLYTTMTTNGGVTASFKLTTATLASIQYYSYAATASDNTTAVSTQGTTTTDATKIFDSKTAAYTLVKLRGSFVTTLGGTFAFQGCQNTSAGGGDVSLILLGSNARVTRVV